MAYEPRRLRLGEVWRAKDRLTGAEVDCKCGTSCLTWHGTDFCGKPCTSTKQCTDYVASTYGPGYPYPVSCDIDGWCIYGSLDAGSPID